MGLFVPALIFIGLAALPTGALRRWAAVGGAGLMFAALGVSAAAIFGPDSDTSIHGSKCQTLRASARRHAAATV